MNKFKIYDGVRDVDHKFSPEFRQYIQDKKLLCYYTTHNYTSRIWLFNKEQQLDGTDPPYLDSSIKYLMLAIDSTPYDGLVKFWKAEEKVTAVGEKCFILTTRDQPFLIRKLASEKILTPYGMKAEDIVTRDAGEGGVVGRVFWNKRMEATPDIGYYSIEENPYQSMALLFNIKGSLVFPLTDSSGCLTHVVETVSSYNFVGFEFLELQQWSGGKYFDYWKDIPEQYNLNEGYFRIAVSEVKEVLKAVGRRNQNLVYAQTWMLSNNCESISTSKKIDYKADASYWCNSRQKTFIEVEYEYTLKKAEGIVGKAAASVHNLVYCEDVSKFCITEYPLAHFAREYKLKSSFAICLRSDLTGNQIYILEFFINTNKFNRKDLRAILVPILERMRQNFQTFKVASGEEIGENLSVLVVDAQAPDKIATLRNRELDLRLAIGINTEGCLPYNLPYSIGESSTHETDDSTDGAESSFYETSSEDTTLVSASTVQSELHVTVNANFRGNFFKFQLYSSSGFHGLSQQVSRQLNLEIGSYIVKYLDEDNDWILVACDDDLHQYILSLLQQGKYTLMIMIEPI